MATTLRLATGPLEAVKTAADDTKAQEVIRRYALSTGAQDDWTNQQLLEHAVQQLATHMMERAKRHKIAEAERLAIEDAETNVGF